MGKGKEGEMTKGRGKKRREKGVKENGTGPYLCH